VSFPGLSGVKDLLASADVPKTDLSGSFLPCLITTSNIKGITFEGRWEADGIARIPININRSPISFWFFSPKNGLNSLALLIGTHQRKNRCRVILRILAKDGGQPIREAVVDARTFIDNSWQCFSFDPIQDSEQVWFKAEVVSTDANSRNFVALWGAVVEQKNGSDLGLAQSPDGSLGIPLRSRRTASDKNLAVDKIFIPRYLAYCGDDSILKTSFGWYGQGLGSKASDLSSTSPLVLPLICPKENLSEIQLLFGTYGQKNRGQVELVIAIANKSAKVLRRIAFDASLLVDNAWHKIVFAPISESNNLPLVVNLRFKGEPGDHLAVWGNEVAKDSAQFAATFNASHPLGYSALDSAPNLTVTEDIDKHYVPFPQKLVDGFKIEDLRVLVVTENSSLLSPARPISSMELSLQANGASLTWLCEEDLASKSAQIIDSDLIIISDVGLRSPLIDFIKACRHLHRPIVAIYDPHTLEDKWLEEQSWFSHIDPSQRRKLSIIQKEKLRAFEAADFRVVTNPPDTSIFENLEVLKIHSEQNDRFSKPSLEELLTKVCAAYKKRYLPSFSIVSVLYGKEQQIEFFLESILRQTYDGKIQVILVNDCSPDRSVAITQTFLDQAKSRLAEKANIEFKIIDNSQNIGNCASRNIAVAQASGEIVVVIDADCMLNKDFVLKHAAAHAIGDCDVVIGAFNIETNGAPPLTILQDYESHSEWAIDSAELQDKINRASFLNCITRNFSIRRNFIDGELFDSTFSYSKDPASGFGWEDVEMGFRLYQHSARIQFIDKTFTIHVSHPSSVDEKTKPYRSLLNFRRLFEKHPQLAYVARRWSLETFAKICSWVKSSGLEPNQDWKFLEREFSKFDKAVFAPVKPRNLQILTYRWHCPHQYELHKLPYSFTMAQDLGLPWTNSWNYDQRPLRPNAQFSSWNEISEKDFDLAILHFDENVLSPQNCAGVLELSWGANFKKLRENLSIPMVAVCHGTPQFYGQYLQDYKGIDFGKVIEEERKRLVDYLGDVLVICNSHQAQREWGFKNSKVIWQGFDPIEFPQSTYRKGILSLGKGIEERPYYRGLALYQQTLAGLPEHMVPDALSVSSPDISYEPNSNQYAYAKYRLYARTVGQYSVYFNPTLRSPMPRSRGEAMMSGLVTVSANNHDVEMFIENSENGFYSNEPLELREYLMFLCNNPDKAKQIGQRSRETAMDLFNHDRFLLQWQNLIAELVG
jgi:glycosyltransferase involved in cell wall biosynthesis